MRILFKTRDPLALGWRDWARARAAFVLRRMTGHLSHASVQITDVDGPRRGVDKRCQVTVVPLKGEPVVVSATARDGRAAVNLALTRAMEALRRLLDRTVWSRRSVRGTGPERLGAMSAPLERLPAS